MPSTTMKMPRPVDVKPILVDLALKTRVGAAGRRQHADVRMGPPPRSLSPAHASGDEPRAGEQQNAPW
jgi:hypothetical protein